METMERYLTQQEERKLLNTVARVNDIYAQRDNAWMRLLRQTGIRVSSCAALSVEDAEEGIATGQLPVNPEFAKRGKGGHVPLNKAGLQALKDLLKIRRDMGHSRDPDGRLIMGRKHRGLSVRSFQARMQHWREEAGLPLDVSPHWFRHTLAMRIMSQSTAANPLGVVSRVLLHNNIASTGIYTRPSREDIQRSMEAAS